jgi:hypothetical protein
MQFFDEGKTAMSHGIKVCADPTVATNVGAQCCSPLDDETLCPDKAGEHFTLICSRKCHSLGLVGALRWVLSCRM